MLQEEPAIVGVLCCLVLLGNSSRQGLWAIALALGAAIGLLLYRILPEADVFASPQAEACKLGVAIVTLVLTVYMAGLAVFRCEQLMHWNYKHRLEVAYVKRLLAGGMVSRYRQACAQGKVHWKGRTEPAELGFLAAAGQSARASADIFVSLFYEMWSQFSGIVRGGNDCFFYPTRLIIAFLGSLVFVTLYAVAVNGIIKGLDETLHSWEGRALDLAYSALQSLQTSFLVTFSFIEPLQNRSPAVAKIVETKGLIDGFFQELLAAVVFSLHFGMAVALIAYAWSWLSKFHSFRSDTRRIRLGDYPRKRWFSTASLSSCSLYAGQQVHRSLPHGRPLAADDVRVHCAGSELDHRVYHSSVCGGLHRSRHPMGALSKAPLVRRCIEAVPGLFDSCTAQMTTTEQQGSEAFCRDVDRSLRFDVLTILIPVIIKTVMKKVPMPRQQNCLQRHRQTQLAQVFGDMILAKGMLIKSYKGYSIFDVVMVHMLEPGCRIRFDRRTSARTLRCIQVFLCAYTGLVTGFVRIATLFVVVLISVNRLNVSIMPAWLDSYGFSSRV